MKSFNIVARATVESDLSNEILAQYVDYALADLAKEHGVDLNEVEVKEAESL